MPANGNVSVQRSVLPDGIAGVDATVKKVVEMAHGNYGSKSAKIRALAINIVKAAGVPDKDYYGEIVAIHNFVRDNIRYVRDPVGQETLSYPEETAFNSKAGDCDDMTILEIAMLGSIGIESYPVVVGMFPNHYSHIYLHAQVPVGNSRNAGKIIPLDPIMKQWSAGREAENIKSKKMYPELSNPLTMNGHDMGQELGDLGAYAVGPSYLDQEYAHAGEIFIDNKKSNIHTDGSVANGAQVSMPTSGMDAMFMAGRGGMPRQAGAENTGGKRRRSRLRYQTQNGLGSDDAFSATSAGDDGTIVQSGGQLVPKGFIRKGPSLQEAMAMTPAPMDRLGPLGPIYEQTMRQQRTYLQDTQPVYVPGQQMTQNSPATITRLVGGKKYELNATDQANRKRQGLSPNPIQLTKDNQVTVLNSLALDRIGAKVQPLKGLGEQLADAEAELAATIPAAKAAVAAASKPQALHYAQANKQVAVDLNKRIKILEQKILTLRQILRDKKIADPTGGKIRAVAVTKGQNGIGRLEAQAAARRARVAYAGQNGLGSTDFMSVIKKPIVWGPILAFAGVFIFMKLRKRRAAAPAPTA